jgi:hypothetical protein
MNLSGTPRTPTPVVPFPSTRWADADSSEGALPGATLMEERRDCIPPGQTAKVLPFPKREAPAFPHNDAHFHPWTYVQHGNSLKAHLSKMDELQIAVTTAAPLPTPPVGSDAVPSYRPAVGNARCGCSYYIKNPELRAKTNVTEEEYRAEIEASDTLVPDTGVDATTAMYYKELEPHEKARFDPMVTGLVLGDVRASEALLRKLHVNPGVFTGVGEITIHKEFVQDKLPTQYQARLVREGDKPVRTAGIKKLIQTCGDIGMPMLIHNDADVLPFLREPGAAPMYFGPFAELLASPECRRTVVIWAHAGGIGKYSHMRPEHLGRLRNLLERLPNLHFDLSWDVVAQQLVQSDGQFDQVKAEPLIQLMNDFPDRFLFGSDCVAPRSAEAWASTSKVFRELVDRLEPETRRKFTKGNYERVYMQARQVVRAYETYCLPIAMEAINTREDLNLPEKEAVQADCRQRLLVAELARWLDLAEGDASHPRAADQLEKIAGEETALMLKRGNDDKTAKKAGEEAALAALQAAWDQVEHVARGKQMQADADALHASAVYERLLAA